MARCCHGSRPRRRARVDRLCRSTRARRRCRGRLERAVISARVATAADVPAIADTLVGAFFADPVWGWAFADERERRTQQRALWTLALEGAMQHGWIFTT